jgi:hypothetical protein
LVDKFFTKSDVKIKITVLVTKETIAVLVKSFINNRPCLTFGEARLGL